LDVCGPLSRQVPDAVRKRPARWPNLRYNETAMTLDWQACSRARLSRDPRFDGKFYIGVLSTKIYCRPICPVPTVKEKNVRYFPTAASAAEVGYRPCLRCRPECSPGTPAWSGTSNTVSRALRLIGESALEDGGIEGLAERLGVTSRHLRRLFIKHLGASPSAVAKTRRLHFAKKLIDETRLPMTDVALASGFGCVRRFNAVIRKTYKRTPTHIRSLAQQKTAEQQDHYHFQLPFRPPYHWRGMLKFLAEQATPCVEAVYERGYRRTISLNDSPGVFEVSHEEGRDSVSVSVQIADPRSLFLIIERIRRMFDLDADWTAIARTLGTDYALASRISAEPGLRVPGCWNGFELTVRAILGEKTSLKRASALAGRIVQEYGQRVSDSGDLTHLFPTPEMLSNAKLADLGLTKERAETIQALSRAVYDGAIGFERIVDSQAFLKQLREIPGISRWLAQYVAMRALGDPDAFPASYARLRSALGLKTSRELERRAEGWRPWRSYSSIYLWSKAER
jgi:AraC family transcriptional regulator of adaptative response / DNA-3-methyladenine glycosylase II